MCKGWRAASRVCKFVLSLTTCVAVAGCAKGVRRAVGEGGTASTQGRGAGATRKAGPVVYVALGDSTGVGVGARKGGGYVARLFERLERERPGSRVVNLCVSGAETGDVLRGQLPRVAAARPTLVTVGIGINDLTHGVEVEQFARNYEEIVARLRAVTDAPVVVTNIPDISTAPRVPAFMREGVSQRGGGAPGLSGEGRQSTLDSNPRVSGNVPVFSTCTPAVWSPLNGVWAVGQPARRAASTESNQIPRW